MKKSVLWTGLGMIALGLACFAAAVFWNTPLDSLFCGFSGALAGPGAVQVYKYVKWTKLETPDSYQRHLEEAQGFLGAGGAYPAEFPAGGSGTFVFTEFPGEPG
ncbi:MAG: hypothetical protein HFG07_05090, partial [Oscillibacter sp.]|nr:hypothetical protein [Oscillibacter sp.]